MTPTATTVLLYLVALFLTVATVWPFSHLAQTIFPETGPKFVWVLIVVVLPFVMLFYFGLAFLIDDTISLGADHLTAKEEELSFAEGMVAAVSYVGLSGWLWMRWRNPSTKILGPAIIARVTAFIIVSVIWAENYDQI